MQHVIQQFMQHVITEGYHARRIRNINVFGFTEDLPNIEGVKFCATSGGRLVTDVNEVMTLFRVMLGEPTSSEFFVRIEERYPLKLINIGKIINLRNTLGTCVLLNGSPEDNWKTINQLKDIMGEPKKETWDFLLSYSWHTSFD